MAAFADELSSFFVVQVGRIWKCSDKVPGLKEKVYEGPTGAFTGIAVTRE